MGKINHRIKAYHDVRTMIIETLGAELQVDGYREVGILQVLCGYTRLSVLVKVG